MDSGLFAAGDAGELTPLSRYDVDTHQGERCSEEWDVVPVDGDDYPDGDWTFLRVDEIIVRDDLRYASQEEAEAAAFEASAVLCKACDGEIS